MDRLSRPVLFVPRPEDEPEEDQIATEIDGEPAEEDRREPRQPSSPADGGGTAPSGEESPSPPDGRRSPEGSSGADGEANESTPSEA